MPPQATGPGTGTRHLTDRERYRVRVLFFDGHKTRAEIAAITGYTPRQITNAIRHETVAPRTGRPPTLTPAQQERLDSFVSASVENSRMTYLKISQTLFDGQVGESAIRNTLHRLGYRRNGTFNSGARLVRSHPRQTNASTPSSSGGGEIPPPTNINAPPTSTNPPATASSTNTRIISAEATTPTPTTPASMPSTGNASPVMTMTPTTDANIQSTNVSPAPPSTTPMSTSSMCPNEDATTPSITEARKNQVENDNVNNAPQ